MFLWPEFDVLRNTIKWSLPEFNSKFYVRSPLMTS